jgi:hypothetical protein
MPGTNTDLNNQSSSAHLVQTHNNSHHIKKANEQTTEKRILEKEEVNMS